MVLTEMASAALAGVVDIVRREKDGVTWALRARRRAHRRQIMIDARTELKLVRVLDNSETLDISSFGHRRNFPFSF
jgi:hypothetical protein